MSQTTVRLRVRRLNRAGYAVFEVVRRSFETSDLVVLGEFRTEQEANRYIGEIETRHALLSEEDGAE